MIERLPTADIGAGESAAAPIALPPLALHEMLLASCRRDPTATLIDFLGRRLSYGTVVDEARRIAGALANAGIEPGDRVGLHLPNVPLYVTAYYGALMAGAVVVNFSPLYSAADLCHQVEDSGTRLLFTLDVPQLLGPAVEVLDGSSLERLVVGDLCAMLPSSLALARRILRRKDMAQVPRRPDVLGFARFVKGAAPAEPLRVEPATALALIQYTGGTTGTPKGAMLTHQNLSANARQINAIDPHRGERDMIIGALPLFHVFANSCVLNRTVADGGTMALVPRFDAGLVLKTIARCRATAMPGVPTMYQALLDHPNVSRTDFSSLRVCISGGAPLAEPLRQRFESATGARLVEGYGLTECSGVASTNPYEGLVKPGTIGVPLPGTRFALLDRDDPTRRAAPGEPGELIVQGPQVMAGYWGRSSDEALIDGNWLRTGDIALIDQDGYARIVDRAKDMISVGGFKVYPGEIEKVLLTHPDVREALVIGVPDAYRGESPAGFVVAAEGRTCDAPAILAWVNRLLGKHERLSRIECRAGLPRTMVGKLDRRALRAEVLPSA